MILDTTNRSLEILLGGAITTNQLPVTVDFIEFTSTLTTPTLSIARTNNITPVTILAAPTVADTQRKVNLITIANTDTAPALVTVRLNNNGTMFNYLSSFFLANGNTLQFTDTRGWTVIDSTGAVLVASGAVTDIQVFSSSGTWIKPTYATYVQVTCIGAGGGGGSGMINRAVGSGGPDCGALCASR